MKNHYSLLQTQAFDLVQSLSTHSQRVDDKEPTRLAVLKDLGSVLAVVERMVDSGEILPNVLGEAITAQHNQWAKRHGWQRPDAAIMVV